MGFMAHPDIFWKGIGTQSGVRHSKGVKRIQEKESQGLIKKLPYAWRHAMPCRAAYFR